MKKLTLYILLALISACSQKDEETETPNPRNLPIGDIIQVGVDENTDTKNIFLIFRTKETYSSQEYKIQSQWILDKNGEITVRLIDVLAPEIIPFCGTMSAPIQTKYDISQFEEKNYKVTIQHNKVKNIGTLKVTKKEASISFERPVNLEVFKAMVERTE